MRKKYTIIIKSYCIRYHETTLNDSKSSTCRAVWGRSPTKPNTNSDGHHASCWCCSYILMITAYSKFVAILRLTITGFQTKNSEKPSNIVVGCEIVDLQVTIFHQLRQKWDHLLTQRAKIQWNDGGWHFKRQHGICSCIAFFRKIEPCRVIVIRSSEHGAASYYCCRCRVVRRCQWTGPAHRTLCWEYMQDGVRHNSTVT